MPTRRVSPPTQTVLRLDLNEKIKAFFACCYYSAVCRVPQRLRLVRQAAVDMPQASGQGETQTQSENLVVHYLDVGQGDSEFIELPNGETMLIDAGETDKGETVVNDISALGCNKITYLVATHPHSDHIAVCPQCWMRLCGKRLFAECFVFFGYIRRIS